MILMLSNYKSFSQQNIYFKEAKETYDKYQEELVSEFRYKILYANEEQKITLQKQFLEVSNKIDSARRSAYLEALIKTKVARDLGLVKEKEVEKKEESYSSEAKYSTGILGLTKEVSEIFPVEAIQSDAGELKTLLTFMVEKDGSINVLKAEGEHRGFNRWAEVTLYLVSGYFIPAYQNGNPVRSLYRFPMKMRFE